MSEPTSATVECPICGEAFDPTAAGGWCTNPDCGEWQYLGEEVPEPESSADADVADEAGEAASDAEADEPADAEADEPADAEVDEPATDEAAADTEADEPSELDRDLDEPVASANKQAAENAEAAEAEADDTAAEAPAAETGAETGDETSEAGDEAAATEPDAAEASDVEPDTAAETDEEPAEAAETADEAGPAATCPDCGTTVDPDDNFCADCGADLGEAAAPTLEECPDCGAEVDADDSFCANCGEDLEAARAGAAEASPAGEGEAAEAPESLVLRARGETVAVSPDQTVGREIRRIVTESGGDEDEAVRIHREHVRFVREEGQFYLVDLGDNPTRVNDRRLSKGDREPVEPGDEIELSGVVTLAVEAP